MNRALPRVIALAPVSRSRLALSAALGALTVAFGVGLMATAGYLISRAAERPAVLSLMVAIVAVRFCGLGRPIARYLERLASHDLALGVLGRVRSRFYERVEPLAPAQLEGYRAGDLLSRMVADVDALQNLYLRGVGPPLVALLAGALSVGAAAGLAPAAGAVLACGLLVAGIGLPALGRRLAGRAAGRQASARGRLCSELIELIDAAPEIAAYRAEPAALAGVREADRSLVELARRDALSAGATDALGLLVTGATVCGVLAVGIGASAGAGLDRVLIAALALLAMASFEATTPLAASARELSSTLGAGRRVLELIDQEPHVRDPVRPLPAPRWPFAVALEHVRARYPGQPAPALDGLTLRLEPGERVALVGPSGAGKTTAANLLMRFLDPELGRVTLAGRDLREYRQADVRRAVAVVAQDVHLFSATIRENLRLARPDVTDAEIEAVLSRARIWDWIATLPEGLDTRVGDRGGELSGGQRQRIALARTLLAGAPVLVLDEPTAHLDPRTALELVQDVLSAAEDRSVLLITHRTEGLDLVDRVISL